MWLLAHCWSLTWCQIRTVEEKSASLPGCKVDTAGRKEKVTSTHPCRTPWCPGASHPHRPLPRPSPSTCMDRSHSSGHNSSRSCWWSPDLRPSLAPPFTGCREWTAFLLCPCHGPGRVFGSLLLCLCFLYASFLFKCHRSLHQLISLYMDGIQKSKSPSCR